MTDYIGSYPSLDGKQIFEGREHLLTVLEEMK